MKIKYLRRYHEFFIERLRILANKVRKLKKTLPQEKYIHHQSVKLYGRIVTAMSEIIPDNPNLPQYRLKGDLSLFKRFKKGLQRYRLFFCNSNTPPVILYLYLNDEAHLRKEDSKTDPYVEFQSLVDKGIFSADPQDPHMQKWIYNDLEEEIAQ